MKKAIHLRMVTPGGEAEEFDCAYVNLPTGEGSIGVLRGHAPIICALVPGRLRIRLCDESELCYRIDGGVARVAADEMTLLLSGAQKEE